MERKLPITLDGADEVVASYMAPKVGAESKIWMFEVTVTNDNDATTTDQGRHFRYSVRLPNHW